jgi:hypothetical protein
VPPRLRPDATCPPPAACAFLYSFALALHLSVTGRRLSARPVVLLLLYSIIVIALAFAALLLALCSVKRDPPPCAEESLLNVPFSLSLSLACNWHSSVRLASTDHTARTHSYNTNADWRFDEKHAVPLFSRLFSPNVPAKRFSYQVSALHILRNVVLVLNNFIIIQLDIH